MGKDYVIELTPPNTEEIRNARPLATVLPRDVLTHAMSSLPFVRLEKMIALCRKGRRTVVCERLEKWMESADQRAGPGRTDDWGVDDATA